MGFFYENNDFYLLIRKPPTKTLRTYTFNDNNKFQKFLFTGYRTKIKKQFITWLPFMSGLRNITRRKLKIYTQIRRSFRRPENAVRGKKYFCRTTKFADSVNIK